MYAYSRRGPTGALRLGVVAADRDLVGCERRDQAGSCRLGNGIHLCQWRARDYRAVERMVLMK